MPKGKPDYETADRNQLVVALPKMLVYAGEISARAGDQYVFEPYGLSTFKYIVLSTLKVNGGQPSMTALKDKVMRSPSNMTQVIDSLEENGLVRRTPSPTDRRVNQIEITEKGVDLLENVERFFIERMQEFLTGYSDEELQSCLIVIRKFVTDSARILGLKDTCCGGDH